jgi:hypothetical protein
MRQCSKNCPGGKELAGPGFRKHIATVLADEQTSPEQFAIYRRRTPGRRLALAEQLYWTARRMKTAWLRELHSDWPEEKVSHEVTRIFTNANLEELDEWIRRRQLEPEWSKITPM